MAAPLWLQRYRSMQWLCLLGLAVPLAGCGAGPTGAQILADLERDRVPLPHAGDRDQVHAAGTDAAAGPTLPAGELTLTDLFAVAEARNPRLAAARSRVGVAAGQVWQASLYPNPTAEIFAEEIPLDSGFGDGQTTVGLTQPVILGGRRQAAISAAQAERAARLAEVELERREIFGEVGLLHARLIALRRQQRLTAELLDLARQTVATARTRFEAGAATEPEVIRPEVEVFQLESASNRLSRELDAVEARLGLLLNTDPVEAERLSGELDEVPPAMVLGALEDVVRRTHPALLVADRETAVAAARLEQVRAERVPDLEVHAGIGYSGESDQGIAEVGAGVELPLWDRRQGDILSARFELMRARQARQARENELLGQLAAAHGEYEAARAQLRALREQVVPGAQRAFEQIGEAYRAGRVSFLELLDAQRTLMEARRTLTELAGDAAAARARVGQIVGTEFFAAVPGEDQADMGGTEVDRESKPPSGAEVIE